MASVYDVAQYILAKYGEVDAMKLQKLVYYSQAWRLVQSGQPLFEEPVKAYENGPVIGLLFYQHKGRRYVTPDVIGVGSKDSLTPEECGLIECVLAKYASMSARELSDLTHSESPWLDAWELRSWDDVIKPSVMKDFYSHQYAYEPTLAPALTDMRVTYVRRDDLSGIMSSIEDADDISGFLSELGKARSKILA